MKTIFTLVHLDGKIKNKKLFLFPVLVYYNKFTDTFIRGHANGLSQGGSSQNWEGGLTSKRQGMAERQQSGLSVEDYYAQPTVTYSLPMLARAYDRTGMLQCMT
jgi:hypothetical protein